MQGCNAWVTPVQCSGFSSRGRKGGRGRGEGGEGGEAKVSKYQMPNDQMSNYGVQTQYVSIRFTSLKCKQIREKS